MNDPEHRKSVTALKSAMTYCQRKYPPAKKSELMG